MTSPRITHTSTPIDMCIHMYKRLYTSQITRTKGSENQKANINNAKLNKAKYANYVFSFCNDGLCLPSLFSFVYIVPHIV